jgi:hypothetical protein
VKQFYVLVFLLVYFFSSFGQIEIIDPGIICSRSQYLTIELSETTPKGGIWTGPHNNFNGNSVDMYKIDTGEHQITYSVNGKSDTLILKVREGEGVNELNQDTTICIDEEIFLSLAVEDEGVNYLWNTGDTTPIITAHITEAKVFKIKMTRDNGCISVGEIVVAVSSLPEIDDFQGEAHVCEGYSAIIGSSNNPYLDYEWSNGETTSKIDVYDGGDYSLIVTDRNGCSTINTATLVEHSFPKINLGKDIFLCANDTAFLDASVDNGYNYYWSNGITNSSQMLIGSSITYSHLIHVIVSDSNGCVGTDTVEIYNLSNLEGYHNQSICIDQNSVISTRFEGVNYLWDNKSKEREREGEAQIDDYEYSVTYFSTEHNCNVKETFDVIPRACDSSYLYQGVVKEDSFGPVIKEAIVKVEALGIQTSTNSDGEYRFLFTDTGSFEIGIVPPKGYVVASGGNKIARVNKLPGNNLYNYTYVSKSDGAGVSVTPKVLAIRPGFESIVSIDVCNYEDETQLDLNFKMFLDNSLSIVHDSTNSSSISNLGSDSLEFFFR